MTGLILNAQTSSEDFEYPDEAIENRIQGKVYVQFSVQPTGEIIDESVQIAKGLGYGLDEIAIETVKNAPPMARNDITKLKKSEPTQFILPILFSIEAKHWASYHFRKGQERYMAGQLEQAIERYSLALGFIEDEPKFHYALYAAYMEMDDTARACKNLKKAKKMDKAYTLEWKEVCK